MTNYNSQIQIDDEKFDQVKSGLLYSHEDVLKCVNPQDREDLAESELGSEWVDKLSQLMNLYCRCGLELGGDADFETVDENLGWEFVKIHSIADDSIVLEIIEPYCRTAFNHGCNQRVPLGDLDDADENYAYQENWQEWVYVVPTGKYFNLRTREYLSPQQFTDNCAVWFESIPKKLRDDKQTAHRFNMKHLRTLRVEVAEPDYRPDVHDAVVINHHGLKTLNLFNPASVPKLATDAEFAEYQRYIGDVDSLINLLANRDNDIAEVLWGWLRWQVRKPGRIIGFCPVLIGNKRVGKTLFCKLAQTAIGFDNSVELDTRRLESNFTNWNYGYQLGVITELRVMGKNRHDIANMIKPLITDTRITRERKYQDSENIINRTNYIATSNFEDCIPLTDDEMRYYMVLSDARKGDLPQEVYVRLHSLIEKQPGVLRRYLLKHGDLPQGWADANFVDCPHSPHFERVLRLEHEKIEGYDEAVAFLEEHGDPDEFNTTDLWNYYANLRPSAKTPSPHQKRRVYDAIGYELEDGQRRLFGDDDLSTRVRFAVRKK